MNNKKSKYIEFLKILQEALGNPADGKFATILGKSPHNMSAYLSGGKIPGKRAIEFAIRHLAEWPIKEIWRFRKLNPKDRSNLQMLPQYPGVYIFYDSAGCPLYIGKAKNLRTEVAQRLGNKRTRWQLRFESKAKRIDMQELTQYISLYGVLSPRMRTNLEALLIDILYNILHNKHSEKTK